MRIFNEVCLLWAMSIMLIGGLTNRLVADDSLLAHLKFNEMQGNVAKDSSGNNNSAKLVNIEWEKYGVEGGAVRLNGKNSCIEFGKNKNLDFTQNFTLSLWFKVKAFDGKGRSLWTRGNYSRGWQSYIFRSFVALSSVPGKTKSGVYYCRLPQGIAVSTPFEQIVITGEKINDEKTKITYYINGKKGKSFFAGKLPIYSTLQIGRFASQEGQWFNGLIDEAKVYKRPLTHEEIKKDYLDTIKAGKKALSKNITIPTLKTVKLPPLKKKRVAIFSPEANFPSAKRCAGKVNWYAKELKKLGFSVSKITSKELTDCSILNTNKFDTLILPFGYIPFEGENSIFVFLKNGGTLITPTCVPTVWKRDTNGKMKFKQHTRGWYSPFLIRHLPFKWARRKLDQKVVIDSTAAKAIGDLLPAAVGPYPRKGYCLVDRWNLQRSVTGRVGDSGRNDKNICLAADVMLPLYRRANGEATDFHVYRYFNNHISGGTMIELGQLGTQLLQGPEGGKILRALLHFAENKLPGEQNESYYRQITKLHKNWSLMGKNFLATQTKLRNAAFFSYLTKNGKWQKFNTDLIAAKNIMDKLKKQELDWEELLVSGKTAKIASASDKFEKQLIAADKKFSSLQYAAGKVLAKAKPLQKNTVNSPYGKLLVESFLTLPVNLYMLRTWDFKAKKDLGVNMVSGRVLPLHNWYLDDAEVRRQLKGLMINCGIQYCFSRYMLPNSGSLSPLDGTINDTPPQKDRSALSKGRVKEHLDRWLKHGITPFRIGLANETGMGLKYWGTQACNDYQKYLKEKYSDKISALNKHWGTTYSSFNAIKLPTRKPKSTSEHAAWEHWRNLREQTFENFSKSFYETVKQFSPDTKVSNIVSTGCFESPLYGVNFYNMSRYQDINGMDGTGVPSPKEWLYLDLTRKPILSCEWGGLYTPASLSYVNGKLWEELTGGSLGFDFWNWQFADQKTNYIGYNGLPTLYGNQACETVKAAKKIEHVILDGHRTKPEIGILYSHTTRMHDQAWGSHGNKTVSPHVQAVCNYYEQLLRFHRSARVIPEEKILEENIDYLKMLIVPQATFLSKKVQEKLLAYVKKGGSLILEGNAGKFDNFGAPLNMLFQAVQVIPAYTSSPAVEINGKSCRVVKNDSVFALKSLSGKSSILGAIGKDAAVLEKPLAKGKIIFIGFSAGLKRYANFQKTLNAIWRSLGVAPRFAVSNPDVLLREWKYKRDTYLLLASRSKKAETFPLEIRVRGKCQIEDYLFGITVKSEFKDGYTVFKTLMANGGRIFRIKNGAPSSSSKNVKFAATGAGLTSNARSDEKNITLPYRGNIYADTTLKWQGYTFRNSTIASGIDQRQGATYIIINKGAETQKKRIKVETDYYFRMRDAIFKIRSSNNFYKFPFHSTVVIEKVDKIPPKSGCSIKKKDKALILNNGVVRLRIEPERGGMISGISLDDDLVNQVASNGSLSACSENIGQVPGPFHEIPFAVNVLQNDNNKLIVKLFNTKSAQEKILHKTITLLPGTSGFKYDLSCINVDSQVKSPPFELRWHPELAIGGICDNSDIFIIPGANGIQQYCYTPSNSGKSFMNPTGNWAAVVDSKEKLAYITVFRPKQVDRVYLWLASSFYDLEIFSKKQQVRKGESIDLNLEIYLLRGLTGLDAYSNGFGAQVALPNNFDQHMPIRFAVEVASAYKKILPVKITSALLQGSKKIADFGGTFTDTVAYDQPIKHFLEADLKKYPDGVYQLKQSIQIGKYPQMTIMKKLYLGGKQLKKYMEFYDECQETIKKLSRKKSAKFKGDIFCLYTSLEEFRSKINNGQLLAAKIQYKKLIETINKLKKVNKEKQ